MNQPDWAVITVRERHGVTATIITDQKDTDSIYVEVDVAVITTRDSGEDLLIISRDGHDLAWHAPGTWLKVAFA